MFELYAGQLSYIGWRGFKIDVNINRADIFKYIDRFIYRD